MVTRSKLPWPVIFHFQGDRIAAHGFCHGCFGAHVKLPDRSGEIRRATLHGQRLDLHRRAVTVQDKRFLCHLTEEIVKGRIIEWRFVAEEVLERIAVRRV